MKTQWPAILYHSVILECEGSPTTVGVYPTEAAALNRLEVARKQIVNDTDEPIWFYVETVRNGTVVGRRDLNTENSMQEANALCLY